MAIVVKSGWRVDTDAAVEALHATRTSDADAAADIRGGPHPVRHDEASAALKMIGDYRNVPPNVMRFIWPVATARR